MLYIYLLKILKKKVYNEINLYLITFPKQIESTCILKINVLLIATDYKNINEFESVKLQFIGNNPIHCNLCFI